MRAIRLFEVMLLLLALGLPPVALGQGSGSTLTMALSRDPSTMDPQAHGEGFTDQVHIHIFDGLLYQSSENPDPKTRIQFGLATGHKLLNPTTWRISLRANVKWHDGNSFTAEDVKFTFDRLLNPANKLAAAVAFPTVKEVRVVDRLTVDFVTKQPDPIFLVRLSSYGNHIISKKYFERVGPAVFAKQPVGTGPYKFVRWLKDQEVVLEAFQDYWGGERQIKRLVFKTIPDIATRVAALQTGAVDIIGEGGIPPAVLPQLEKDPNIRVSNVKGAGNNMHLQLETRKGTPLSDRRVRLGIAHALNIDSIIQNVLGGGAKRTPAVVTEHVVGFDPRIKPVTYNPELAKKLLAEAGYPVGVDITLNSSGGRYTNEREVVEAMAAQLQRAGVKAKINYMEFGAYINKILSGANGRDMFVLGWSTGGKMDADTQLYAILKCGAVFASFCDPALDRFLDATTTEMNPQKRNQLWSQVENYIVANAPLIPLYVEDSIFAMRKRVLNFTAPWDYRIFLHNARVAP